MKATLEDNIRVLKADLLRRAELYTELAENAGKAEEDAPRAAAEAAAGLCREIAGSLGLVIAGLPPNLKLPHVGKTEGGSAA